MTRRRTYSAEEAYSFLASDSESASEDESSFHLSSASSSSSSDSEQPPRRQRRTATEAAPESSDPRTDPTWTTPDNYVPQVPNFTGNSGIQFDVTGFREVEFFNFYFTEDIITLMVTQTNLYAEQFITQNPTSIYAQPHRWTPVYAREMRTFWGLVLLMGLVKKPSIRSYWSTDILYHTPMFRMAMSRTRFEAILRFLHYSDNAQCPPRDDPNYDRLYKLRPLLEHFSAKFAQAYTPQKHIAIDESLVHFKGRLQFRQYLPSKRARYGVKMYKLCESTSGYTHRFRIYEGRDTRIDPPQCPPLTWN